jgi:hypothetical protein
LHSKTPFHLKKKKSFCVPWDHDPPTEPIHADSSGNQEQPEKDLNMHSVLHYASSSFSSAANGITISEGDLVYSLRIKMTPKQTCRKQQALN